MIIGIMGLKGAGKDTAANHLISHYNFQKESFAASLKDACSVIFNWDREMLEGTTEISREQREIPDPFWSKKLGHDWSPRYALQIMGTDILRKQFYDGLWLASVENRIQKTEGDTVITDVRFPNEVELIRNANGLLINIVRGEEPRWLEIATSANNGEYTSQQVMATKYSHVHQSEWACAGTKVDIEISNSGTFRELDNCIDSFMRQNRFSEHLYANQMVAAS